MLCALRAARHRPAGRGCSSAARRSSVSCVTPQCLYNWVCPPHLRPIFSNSRIRFCGTSTLSPVCCPPTHFWEVSSSVVHPCTSGSFTFMCSTRCRRFVLLLTLTSECTSRERIDSSWCLVRILLLGCAPALECSRRTVVCFSFGLSFAKRREFRTCSSLLFRFC